MEGEKKYTKVKLLLFLVFAVFSVLLIANVVRIMQDLFSGISEKNSELRCNDLNFDIVSIAYEENTVSFEIINNDPNTNISKIMLTAESGDYVFNPDKEISSGGSLFVKQDNLTINRQFGISINECDKIKNFNVK
jgi:hypothetical protein